ncbi:carbon storage regulator [Pseudomonas luteola]|uniref:carbon storage regulator n=1 Tax=Pseudomonas luteola TaxID=47886 RepID=UPI003A8BE73D
MLRPALPGHNDTRNPALGTLCISRKHGETFIIGDDITITVLFDHSQANREARLVITAPKKTRILRSEIKDDGRTRQ